MKRLLIQTQLSNVNYAKNNQFDLACDSGWQMVAGRVREMLKLNSELDITIMGPQAVTGPGGQLVEWPEDVNPDLWKKYGSDGENRLHYVSIDIINNALVTRYDFDWTDVAGQLTLGMQKAGRMPKWDAVYINDPMHLRNFMAMFYVVGGYQPKFYVHSHFVDVPEVPKFPKEASLWLGQCEAAIKAEHNFWQCESAMLQFFDSMGKWYNADIVELVKQKSTPWDDGYSSTEVSQKVNISRMRFTPKEWKDKTDGKVVIFFPNRISPSSNDYTNGMKFMFELLPQLWAQRQDFVVVCGNPNQKFTNKELEDRCGQFGYISLTPDTFDRNEYRYVAGNSHIALGLYDQDAYGGTAARECVELGCMPLWLDCNEYSSIAREAGGYPYLVSPDWSNFLNVTNRLIDQVKHLQTAYLPQASFIPLQKNGWLANLQRIVRQRCSYELTTPAALLKMGLLT